MAKKQAKKTGAARLGALPQTAETRGLGIPSPDLRGVRIPQTGLRLSDFQGPEVIPASYRAHGFTPTVGAKKDARGNPLPDVVSYSGHPTLERAPKGPVGSYIVAGERASTATPLTPAGQRFSGSSPMWIETESGPVNIDRNLAGMGEGISVGGLQAKQPTFMPATPYGVESVTPPPPAQQQAPPVPQDVQAILDLFSDPRISDQAKAFMRGQLHTIERQLGKRITGRGSQKEEAPEQAPLNSVAGGRFRYGSA